MFVIIFFPLKVHRYCGLWPSLKMVLNAFVTVSPFLSFNGTIQPYLENISNTIRRYL